MKLIFKMERVLITGTGILCTVLILKILYSLRTILPWRVNCWFCNSNFWVKFFERNCWTCPKCEQYNGFTKDGNYNKPLFSPTEPSRKTPKVFPSSPPNNGLCKMCNINQQLKVTQLSNFVPMNERNFDEEIESYRMQLEKAYKLCSPCKKVLQMKLHREKEVLLGTKLLATRTPDKKTQKKELRNHKIWNLIHSTSIYLAVAIFILVSIEFYSNVMKNKSLLTSINNTKDILSELLERIVSIVKMKMLMTFPMLEKYLIDVHKIIHLDKWPKHLNLDMIDNLGYYNILTQEALLGVAVILQAIGYFWSKNDCKSTFATDFLWSAFGITCIVYHSKGKYPTAMSFGKLLSLLLVIIAHKRMKIKPGNTRISISPKIKMNVNKHTKTTIDEDTSMETDDDVSLSQFGLHNFSESSNESVSPMNNSLISGRSFTPRTEKSIWTKPKLNSTMNSTFRVNPVLKSPSSISETIFAKPSFQKFTKEESFNKYQKLSNDDSDSDLDESISSLCIGSPKKSKSNSSVFSLRKFTATPNFVAPTPLTRSRPLISPSKLGHSTSWVAGGYWGSEGDRQLFSVDGSRSSSQSSGFESQASSLNQRNVMSQPSSREESVCGDPDRPMLDRFQNCNMSNCSSYQNGHAGFHGSNIQSPQNFSHISSPVFPQMQYNSHVHIPQPRFAQQCLPNAFAQQQLGRNNFFKTPSGSNIIKLPQNSFVSR